MAEVFNQPVMINRKSGCAPLSLPAVFARRGAHGGKKAVSVLRKIYRLFGTIFLFLVSR